MNFIFYDTETTGTDTFFDQILQFAAILTDEEFNEIDRFEVRCRIQPHIIPAPMALIVTQISIDQLTDASLPSHYEMVQQIQAKLESWSPAIFIGYNSISFDEALLRQAFYQTLNPPYLTAMNGNGRTDLLHMVRAISVFAPEVLSIPTNDKGNPVFKLDQLAPLNGFSHENAHDALNDVEATIHLSRLIKTGALFVWEAFIRNAYKKEVMNFIDLNVPVFSQTEFYFNRPYPFLVTPLGSNPSNGSEIFTINLAHDPAKLAGLGEAALAKAVAASPTPVRSIKTNAAPIVFSVADMPSAMIKATGIPIDDANDRAAMVQADQSLKDRLIEAKLASRDEYEVSPHVEAQIYDGFFSWDDQALMKEFHAAEWANKLTILEKFTDARLKQLGQRLIYFEQPDVLNEETRDRLKIGVGQRLCSQEDDIPSLTISGAYEEVEKARGKAEDSFLDEIEDFLKQKADL
ncbi:MAG: exodeoxyribonuclease I [Hyphomicrobiales bacterium]|nr:exodeoxyribonuclease I [Hyphomicrobiales bacterium]